MSLASALAIYFVIWWISLFAVLPFGVKTQAEEGDIVPGSSESAPVRPRILRIAMINTLVAAIIFAAFYYVVVYSGLTLDDLPI